MSHFGVPAGGARIGPKANRPYSPPGRIGGWNDVGISAYVPLDSDLPRERLDFILEDSAAPVLVTNHCRPVRYLPGARAWRGAMREWLNLFSP